MRTEEIITWWLSKACRGTKETTTSIPIHSWGLDSQIRGSEILQIVRYRRTQMRAGIKSSVQFNLARSQTRRLTRKQSQERRHSADQLAQLLLPPERQEASISLSCMQRNPFTIKNTRMLLWVRELKPNNQPPVSGHLVLKSPNMDHGGL